MPEEKIITKFSEVDAGTFMKHTHKIFKDEYGRDFIVTEVVYSPTKQNFIVKLERVETVL